jgi:alkylhydroperoxidase family enzyme
MSDKDSRGVQHALVARIVDGEGTASNALRRSVFDNDALTGALRNLAGKVATRPTSITNADIAAVRGSGLSEDQIFEVVVCAAVGQASRQYEAALTALDQATERR